MLSRKRSHSILFVNHSCTVLLLFLYLCIHIHTYVVCSFTSSSILIIVCAQHLYMCYSIEAALSYLATYACTATYITAVLRVFLPFYAPFRAIFDIIFPSYSQGKENGNFSHDSNVQSLHQLACIKGLCDVLS